MYTPSLQVSEGSRIPSSPSLPSTAFKGFDQTRNWLPFALQSTAELSDTQQILSRHVSLRHFSQQGAHVSTRPFTGAWLIKIHLNLMKSCVWSALRICGWDAVAIFSRASAAVCALHPPCHSAGRQRQRQTLSHLAVISAYTSCYMYMFPLVILLGDAWCCH
jgi:hypothetical protein